MENSARRLSSIINVKIKYYERINNKIKKIENRIISINLENTLNHEIYKFFEIFNIEITGKYYLYLMKKNHIEKALQEDLTGLELGLKEGDNILVSYLPNIKKINEKLSFNYQNKNKKIKIIKIIILTIISLLLISGIISIIILMKRKKKEETSIENDNFQKEKLIIEKYYPNNLFMRFKSRKESIMKAEGEGFKEENSTYNFSQISDFLFIVRKNYTEKDINNKIQKEYYTGYIAFLNVTLKNKTDDMITVYDKTLNNFININNIQRLEEDELKYVGKEGNLCFAKLEFYQNGEIRNYYLPNGFEINNFPYIEDIARLIIPKISPNLYVKSINETLNELISNSSNFTINNEFINQTTDVNQKNEVVVRRLNENKVKIYKKYKMKHNINKKVINKRRLNNESFSLNYNYTESNYTGEIELEEYLSIPLADSLNYDLREVNKHLENSNEINSSKIYSNLTEFSMKTVENDMAQMEGSIENTTIHTFVNNEGILESVEEIMTTLFKSPNDTSSNEDIYTTELYNRIYDNTNQISYNDIINNKNESEPKSENNISFNLSSLSIISTNLINCSNYFIDEQLNQKLYNYFDKFNYELFAGINNNESISIINEEENMTRNLEEKSEYYGIKKMNYVKQLYKYNLIGLRMEKQILTEINPSTGITNSYFILIFGNKNLKMKMEDQYSNLHIITDKKNQMGYNLILLLQQSNFDLINRSKMYADVIIDIEKNMTELFNSDYDFSNLFVDSLNDMYMEVKNFNKNFFFELIELINKTYDNYTKILDDVTYGKYDIINEIKKITKEEYINYIYNMVNILEIFENNTLKFLCDIEDELIKISDFQIDILYDIIDNIYESRLIFKKFNRNLFNSIEKGIIKFKYDITEYITDVIGDLLYITDFLSININKNEILVNSIDEFTREEIKIKLKNFRNIILEIIDLLILDINEEYQEEMNIENNNSIKFYSNEKALIFINNTEKKSSKVINDIKSRINNIQLYELYSNNIDIINNINNKSIIEYIDDIYRNIICNLNNLKPEYYNEKSNINKNKKQLFDISKKIINEINKEINDINNYISEYSHNYSETNLYNIHYNLYYISKSFIKEGIDALSNEIIILVNNSINRQLKNEINSYFENALQDFRRFKRYLDNCSYKYKIFGMEVINKYGQYIEKFNNFLEKILSDELLNLIEKHLKNLNNKISQHVINKLLSINKFCFDIELYKHNFYLFKQTEIEILKLLENINTYFNEIFYNDIKVKAFQLISDTLYPYYNTKIKEFDNYYNYLYKRISYTTDSYEYDFKCQKDKDNYGWVKLYLWSIQYSFNNLNNFEDFLETNAQIISIKFINKFDGYLNSYSSYINTLYFDLYNNIQIKIKNNKKIGSILNEYQTTFINFIKSSSEFGLFYNIEIEIKSIEKGITNYLNKLKENTNLLEDLYFNLYYSKNNTKFLEFPEEIIYKIYQFQNELKSEVKNIKDVINFNYKNKLKYIYDSTFNYIYSYIKNNFIYIKSKINSNSIMNQYYISINQKLNTTFNNCINNLKNTFDEIRNNIEENSLLNNQNYNELVKKIINDLQDFISYFEDIINQNFTYEYCQLNPTDYIDLNSESITYDNNTDENYKTIENNTIICQRIKKQFDTNFSKYNFNIVKLREGIKYSKTLLENIDDLFDEFNASNLININKIVNNDKLINDNNIFLIYNETNYKMMNINKESVSLIDELLQTFIEDFQKKYSYKSDYLNLIKIFKEIISFKNNDYNNKINNINNDTLNNIISFLNEFNETLFSQLLLRDKYDYFNFNQTYFKEIYFNYYSLIEKFFKEYIHKISSLNESYIFHNSIRAVFRKLQNDKREFFKNITDNFSKEYDFSLLNITYELGEYLRLFMEKEYFDFEFSNIYDYVEFFENFTNSYIFYIISKIKDLELISKERLKILYDKFYLIYDRDSSNYIDANFIIDLKINNSICLDYSYELLNKNKNENEFNLEKYNQHIELINLTFEECCINDTNPEIYNFSINEKINYIKNNSNNCFNYILNLETSENISDFNKSLQLLNCYNNNFYNYSVKYFNKFDDNIKNRLDNIMNKISLKIKNNYIDDIFLYDYLDQNYQLEPYKNITLSDLSLDLDSIEGMINYANFLKNEDYKTYLANTFIDSFNSSYYNLIHNYILDEIISNINVYGLNKFEMHLEYLTKKLIDEYNYYILILNSTEELGYSSKNAFINLYENINKKLNDTIFYLIEENIFFYLDIFQRDIKIKFRNNFINYYVYDLNEYDLSILKLSIFYEEIILDTKFNKTLDKICIQLVNDIIIKKIKELINISLHSIIHNLFNITDSFKLQIKRILDNKKTRDLPEDMSTINELINNYTILVNNQNNHYSLNISENPFIQLFYFIHNELEPPLIVIKEEYNKIEDKLLNKIFNITSSFPDYYSIVKERLNLELIQENITSFFNIVKSEFEEYEKILSNDFKSYVNKLIHYTFINGLHTYDKPCKYNICQIDFDLIEKKIDNMTNNSSNKGRRLEDIENENKLFNLNDIKINRSKINKSKNKKIRRLDGYDYTMGAITENDILDYLLYINDTINNFIELYLEKEYINLNNTSNYFLMKINMTYLQLLKKSIHMASIKFITFLTKENYKKFEDNLFEKYNDISFYINNNSNIIDKYKNDFIYLLNSSSIMLEMSFNLSYYRIMGYYKLFCDLIQNKLKYLSEDDMKEYNLRNIKEKNNKDEEDDNDDPDEPNDIRDLEKLKIYFKVEIESNTIVISNYESTLIYNEQTIKVTWEYGIFNRDENGRIWSSVFTEKKLDLDLDTSISMNKDKMAIAIGTCFDLFKLKFNNYFTFPFQLCSFLELVFAIIPSVKISACFNGGFDLNWKKGNYSFFIDVKGRAEASLTLDLGLYVPSSNFPFSISVNVGIHGIIGSGEAGIKLSLYLNSNAFIVDTYFNLKAFVFSFYVMFKITIKISFFKFSYSFYIFNKEFASLVNYEYHIKRGYKYNREEIPELCENEGNFHMSFFGKNLKRNHGGRCKSKLI